MKNLLVCTDGSSYSQEACRYAAWLAEKAEASITVLYVTDLRRFEVPAIADLSGSLGIQPFDGVVSQLQEVEKVKSKFVEEQAKRVFEDAGLAERMCFIHETGLLVDVLKEQAKKADCILLGKRGENVNFAKEHLGSTLERVVRSVQVPCLVGNRLYAEPKEVAVAYDGSASSRKALEYISTHGELLGGMRFYVVSCVEGHNEDLASDRLSEAEELLSAAGLEPTCEMLSGVVECAIADYVADAGIDLLVLGAYGHSRIRELLIGSTTTELLRGCHVPVLCFR